LIAERNRYYPVSADLLEVVLTHAGTRHESLGAELNCDRPLSVLLHGDMLNAIADSSSDLAKQLRDKVDAGNLSVVGGEASELPVGMMSIESALNQLLAGKKTFEEHLGEPASVYLRRTSGLHHLTPRLLEGLGFSGAMHFTLDKAKYPRSSSNCIRWNSIDGSSVMALGERAINGAQESSFLGLGPKIGTELDSAHAATIVFARWPGQSCAAFDDPGYGDTFEADEYENSWPNRDASTAINYWRRWHQLFAIRSLACQLALANTYDNKKTQSLLDQCNQLQNNIESATVDSSITNIDDELSQLMTDLKATTSGPKSVFNPTTWAAQSHLTFDGHSGPEFSAASKFRFAASSGDGWEAVAKLNGMQLVGLPNKAPSESVDLSKAPFVDNETKLQNEDFEVRIDEQSGGIKGVSFYGKRGSLFGQQISARLNNSSKARYGETVCDKVETVRDSRIRSHICASGRLLDGDQILASFQQTTSLTRGLKRVSVQVKIQPTELGEKLLKSGGTFCLRTAWASEAASMACDMLGTRHDVRKPQINAPHFVEVIDTDHRFALICKGLSTHRRTQRNKLETTLMTDRCVPQSSFEFAYAVDCPNIMQTAISEFAAPFEIESGELSGIHIANRDIVVTCMQPVFDDDSKCDAVRIRFQEINGQNGPLKIYSKRKIVAIAKESLAGETIHELAINHDQEQSGSYWTSQIDCGAFDFFQLLLNFE